MITLESTEEIKDYISRNSAVLLYFSTQNCNVCKVLKPKLIDFFNSDFPLVNMGFVNVDELPDAAAQNNIFSVPTILIYFDGKEMLRKSRNINFQQLHNELQRPYSLYF